MNVVVADTGKSNYTLYANAEGKEKRIPELEQMKDLKSSSAI